VALVAAYVLARLLPGLGDGADEAIRWWGAVALYLAAGAACLARAARVEDDRRPWALIGAGILGYAGGSVAGIVSGRPPVDPPVISYVGWLMFYAAAYAAVLLLLRARLRPFVLSFCLDGVLGGLTLATVCAVAVSPDLAGASTAKLAAGLAFPCADLVLLALVIWACAMTGWRGGVWLWLAGGLAVAAAGDIVLDVQIIHDNYDPMALTSVAFPAAMVLIGVAAWRPLPSTRALRTDTWAVLGMPAGAAIVILAVLAVGGDADPTTRILGLAGLVVAMARALLSFGELEAVHGNRRFQRGFEEATIGMALVGADLRWMRVNDALCTLLGRPAERLLGRSCLEVTHPDDRHRTRAMQQAMLAGEPGRPLEKRMQRPDGTIVDILLTAALVEGDDGEPHFFGQIQDMTTRRRAERHSEAIAALSRAALELHDAVDLVDHVTAAVRDGLPADACHLFDAALTEADPHVIGADVQRRGALPGTLVARRRADREPFDGHEERFLEAAANLLGTALDRAGVEDELRTQALEDPLTGLANRSYLAAHVEQAIGNARRGEDLALMLLDLDRFKVVNDTLGHGAGDELLCAVADRLRATVRSADLVARLGGDEFVVACTGGDSSASEVSALAQRLLDAMNVPFVVDGRELHISASAGLVFVDSPDVSAESLLRDADVAMYRAKEHGSGRYEVFDAGLRAKVIHRLAIESELRHAVARDELRLHVQPVVDLHRRELSGFEALVRWEHPERGLVPPCEFIAIAEETGLIVPIGTWVLREAARHLAALQARAGRPLRMSVNLSARQLSPGLVAEVRSALDDAGVAAADLTLEVTETLLVDGPGALEVLTALRGLGLAIAIDDFGTGWSSLGALQRYPVDILKLDRSLVAPAAESASAAALARAVVEMAQALGLDVIAEGIEDDAQLATMQALGCPHGQGYVFAAPMPIDDALALVDGSSGREDGELARAHMSGAPVPRRQVRGLAGPTGRAVRGPAA
jgi:diguanylate cyclase (GGDEF)-like protein/PAS domain S-box-containing protein